VSECDREASTMKKPWQMVASDCESFIPTDPPHKVHTFRCRKRHMQLRKVVPLVQNQPTLWINIPWKGGGVLKCDAVFPVQSRTAPSCKSDNAWFRKWCSFCAKDKFDTGFRSPTPTKKRKKKKLLQIIRMF
jgi:hypothetical protein